MIFSHFSFGFWDVALVVVVTLQATAMAYISHPWWKALSLSLPLPFTTISLAVGRPIDASNVVSLVVLFAYTLCVRFLHVRLRLPIIPVIVFSVIVYIALGASLAGVVPSSDAAFWVAVVGIFALGLVLQRVIPHPDGPTYRTPLPLWQKLPAMFLVVALLVTIKNGLHGFASLFPLLSTVGAYEVRANLWLLVRPVPVLMCALPVLMVVVREMQHSVGLERAFALGWVVFLPVLVWIHRRVWLQRMPAAVE